mgnify:CR=1 FL=1
MRKSSLGIVIGQVLAMSAAFAGLSPAFAQTAPAATAPKADNSAALEEITVTGSRIRRSATDTPAPVLSVDQQTLTDRGYVSAAQAINQLTSATPQLNLASGGGASSGSGQQYPSLFGLGPGRTLTLVNGRRTATTSSGLGDSQVDGNIIPTGLLERIEVVQAGGASVYGSDAIAGVVNYILKKNFEGVEVDAQFGNASRGDYLTQSLRGTFGKNFAEDRGNVAFNVEWAKTPTLEMKDRPRSNLARITGSNSADTGPNDGIPSIREILNAHFWNFNRDGVIYNTPAPVTSFLTRLNGNALQFSPSGDVVTYNTGTIYGVPFAEGGDGFRYSELTGLRTGVERFAANALGHYDISDSLTLSAELLYAKTEGVEIPQGESHTVLNNSASGAGPIMFTRTNPFLTANALATLSAANANFANGAPLWISKYFYDLVPSAEQTTETETVRALLGIDGEFALGGHDMYWSVSGSRSQVDGGSRRFEVNTANYNKAISAVRNTAGQIVCAVNADASTTNDDAACVPINPFGDGNVSDAARSYVGVLAGMDYRNEQTDILATLGGSIAKLPGGEAKFSVAYEHREESVDFVPLQANQLGLFDSGTKEVTQSGDYDTNEFSLELLVPLVGEDFTLPGVETLELSGSYRTVDNSAAGTEEVWNGGLRWVVLDGFTLRASRSRNFRAPTLTQLFAPSVTALGSIGTDPCDADRINGGPNPTVRRANCEALFAANPAYGSLATFQDPSENFARASITTGGNPNLLNEVSDTTSYGIVLQPAFAPGLSFTADRVEIDLQDGLSAFTVSSFAATCYDTSPQPEGICSTFTRLAASDGLSPAGTIITGRTTTFNAGVVKYRGEVYNLNYAIGLGSERDYGNLEFGIEATHNTLLTTSVTGTTYTRTDNTVAQPTWVGRVDVRWNRGPIRVTYQMHYLDDALANANATIENNPNPFIDSNVMHDLSAQYDFGMASVRVGVTNLTDEEPSYPTLNYGNILGRQWYVGLNVKL